jgi:hypothetical protein
MVAPRNPALVAPLMEYCEFFETEDEAIEHCREVNRGLRGKDQACCAVVDGPGEFHDENGNLIECANYAVVDLETARDLLDFGEAGSPTCLIVTD